MLIVFEQSAEKISVPRTEEVTYDGENQITKIRNLQQILSDQVNEEELGRACISPGSDEEYNQLPDYMKQSP